MAKKFTPAAIDTAAIAFFKKHGDILARVSLFIIFFWFGVLKLMDLSPANELVRALLHVTMPQIPFTGFIIFLGLLEMVIGMFFLIKKTERAAIIMLAFHMIATFMPLAYLPQLAWQMPFVPTLEGQYIIKNLAIIALAMGILAHLRTERE